MIGWNNLRVGQLTEVGQPSAVSLVLGVASVSSTEARNLGIEWVTSTIKEASEYTFRTSVKLKTLEEADGETYEFIRHNITLTMKLP